MKIDLFLMHFPWKYLLLLQFLEWCMHPPYCLLEKILFSQRLQPNRYAILIIIRRCSITPLSLQYPVHLPGGENKRKACPRQGRKNFNERNKKDGNKDKWTLGVRWRRKLKSIIQTMGPLYGSKI